MSLGNLEKLLIGLVSGCLGDVRPDSCRWRGCCRTIRRDGFAEQGRDVILSDGARQAGGSVGPMSMNGWDDDNGNHLLLSAMGGARLFGANWRLDELVGPDGRFPLST